MELALGLKITKTRDDIASISEYQLAKDKGPVFQSRETNTMFILSAYLKGYKRNDIDIKISKDGSKISISGKKPIQELLMMGWVMHRKEVKITGFNRVFKIPDGVNLDKIKAKYDEEEWSINIFMPKLVKGICGVRIEEVKEEESEERGKSAQEKNETIHDLSCVGETSQKGSKEGVEGSESFMENGVSDKMLDDANKEINRETIQNEVETSNLGIDGNGESVREKVGQEGHEVMKISEHDKSIAVLVSQKLEDRSQDKDSEVQKLKESENVEKKERGVSDKKLDDASGDITRNRSPKEIEETMLRIEDAKVKGMRERDREAQSVAMKTSEIEQDVGAGTPQKIGDTSGHKDSDIGGMKENGSFVEKKEKMVSDNRIDDDNGNINEEKQKGETISTVEKMETEETSMIMRANNSLTEEDTYGESKQKHFGEPVCEAEDRVKERVKESSVERLEEMKTSELDETVSNHIPSNIVGASLKEEFKEPKIQQMEKTDSNEGKTDGGVSERMHFEANKETQKTIFGDTIHKDIKKPKIETEGGDQECVREKVVKEEFDRVINLCEEFPKQLPKGSNEETEVIDFTKLKEAKDVKEEMVKRKGKEIEYFLEKGEGEGPKEMPLEAKEGKTKEVMLKEIGKSKNGTKDSGKQQVLENTGKGRFDVSNSISEELPKQVAEQDGSKGFKVANMEELKEVIKEEMAENESSMAKVEGEASKKRTEEVIEKSTVTETLEKETEGSKIKRKAIDKPHKGALVLKDPVTRSKGKGQHGLQNDMSKGRFQASEASKEEFPTKKIESLESTREGLQDTKIEESKEGTAKKKSMEKMEKSDYGKEEGAKIEQLVKKVREKKYEKVQVEEDGGLRKDITRENTHEETQEPKVLGKEKNQHCLYEEMGKGTYEASSTARKFPMKVADSLGKTREGSKDKEIEESEEVKGDEAIIMSGETELFGSTTKKKIEESQSGRTAQTLQEAPEEKHPKAVEKRTPERDLQSAKVEGKELNEVEQGSAQDKRQKTKLLPPTIQSNETHESKNDQSASQGTLQPKKSKHVGERQQYTNDKEITKEVPTIEDQVDKPSSVSWFPSTQQSQIDEKDKLYEGSAAKYKASQESQKEDPTKEMQNLIEMKENQECKQTEKLKPKNPLEKNYKKGEVITKDELHRRQKGRETIQEETAEPKIKIDDRDQQYVPMDFGKVVVKVLTIENEMIEKEYVADASPIAEPERMEIKRDFSANLKRDDNTTENVIDEKPKLQEEILKADNEKVDTIKCISESMKTSQEKELHMKSEAFEKEAESSLESVESVGVEEAVPKNQIEELQQKDLSPLTEEMRSKEPLEFEKPVIEWKFPKTKGDGPLLESRERERYGYSSEDTKAAKEEMPKKVQQYVPIDFGKVVVKELTIENEMPKKEYTQAEPERMETKSGLKATFERDEHTVENVIDEQSRIQDEILKAYTGMVDKAKCIPESMESTQEKEHYTKSEVVEKEAESLEAMSSLPSVESVEGEETVPKNEIEELQQKDLSPLTAEMKSKEPQELEKPTREWKLPKTKGDVPLPELRERERYGYGSEDTKAPKITAYQEELLKQGHGEETVLEKRKGSKFANSEEAKEASRQLLKGENGKTTQTAEEKKPKMKEITPEFENASGLKQVAEKMHETGKREHQSEEVTTKMGADPPTPIEITRNKEVERKEPRVLSRPSIENEMPMIKDPQQEKEEERLIHALELEATTSKEEGFAQATKKLSNAKSNAEPKFDIDKPKESIEPTEGATTSEVVADKGAQLSKFSSSSSTQQQFEVEEKDKKDADHEVGHQGSQEIKDSNINVQESTRIETEQAVDKIENLQPQSPADQQCIINKDQEQKHEIEEERAYEQRDEVCGEDFQVLEEQKECKEEASGGKKETKWSKKLYVPLVLAGTALLVSLVFVFVRHRKARKR